MSQGQTSPSLLATGGALAAAVALLFVRLPILASFAVFDGQTPTWPGGLRVLALAAAQSMALVAVSLTPAFMAIVVLFALVIRHPRAFQAVAVVFALLSNLPVLFLLPIWLVVFGNGDFASVSFLIFCFFFLIGYSIFADHGGGAVIAQRVSTSFGFSALRTLLLTIEVVMERMRASVFQMLVLGLPLALAAEMMGNQSGLGYLAEAAYLNGNFGQVGLTAGVYLIAFCILWFVWSALLVAPDVFSVYFRGKQ